MLTDQFRIFFNEILFERGGQQIINKYNIFLKVCMNYIG